ncbi:short chain dehydrogenase [Corynespora cassiicola Philippines]|uniref:Short chain dehydrogenase n=1 Tax=Corynespora cassiicola Philippines TaxID=1448308 RepID=A0A2T2P7J1_CORCC|nr:short chain dehydrogenase [Corynespora cassiicola Philippines]
MNSKTVFIIGANRGIGRKFVDKFKSQGWEVHGSVRPQTLDDETVKDLRETGTKLYEIDYLDESSIQKAAKEYGPGTLDCLINCAGVSHGPVTWQEYDSEILTKWFQIMVVGPLLATKHFQPSLEKSDAGKVVNLTSKLGSIGVNDNGTKIGYKLAKTALNQETRTIAMDLKSKDSKIAVMAVSPGWVSTKLSGWLGDTDIDESVDGMYEIMNKLTLEETGNFWNWSGEKIPF